MKKILNTRMMKWLRATWRVEDDSPTPTWFGKVVIFLMKLFWSVCIVLWWMIVQYGIVGAFTVLIGVIGAFFTLLVWMMYGKHDEKLFPSFSAFVYDIWDAIACKQPDYWHGRDKYEA